MSDILSAVDLAKISAENAVEVNVKDAAVANQIFRDFYNDYMMVEAKYGHYSVSVRNYAQVLGLKNAGIMQAFFDNLDKLGYAWEATNVRTSDTGQTFESLLVVSWDERSRCENCDCA